MVDALPSEAVWFEQTEQRGLQPPPSLTRHHTKPRQRRAAGIQPHVTNRPYDIREVQCGDELIAELTGIMSEDYKSSLKQVVSTGSLPDFLQLPSATEPELMTLGDLSATGKNEDAEQFIDERALRKVLIGRYGIAHSTIKGQEACRLGLPIQVCYRRPPYTDKLTSPIISSGRHRLLALQALLLAAGLSWSDICAAMVRITTVVVADDKQFSQLMENNNTSRSQSQHELKVHSLSGKGIPTGDTEAMLEFAYRATDAATQAEFFAQLVSLLSHGNSDPSFAFTTAKTAWGYLRRANPTDRSYIKELFADADDLSRVAEVIARLIPRASKEAQANPLVRNIATPVARAISIALAAELKVVAPEFPTEQEEALQRLEKQREQVQALEALLNH